MKILFLSRFQNSVERGAENFVTELSQRLSKNNQIEIFSGHKSDSLMDIFKSNADIVIPINGRSQSLKVSLGRLIKKYKILISGHSGMGRDDIWNILVIKPDVFIALTGVMTKWAKKFAWGTKVLTIPDGVDLDKFTASGVTMNLDLERPIILSVGALVWYKHHEKAIEAVSRLERGSLLIAGDGNEKLNLEKLGKSKLGTRFKIMSFPYMQMPQVYRAADLFTLPSWDREAFGIVYLEAMASGLGVVAPNDSARSEIIGEAGILIDVSNSQKYAQAIEQALTVGWKAKALSQAKKFSWDKIAKMYEEVMLEMLKND